MQTIIITLFMTLHFSSLGKNGELPPLKPMPHVAIDRYLGLWHEIARLPNKHQIDCVKSEAEYRRDDDGKIRIRNFCVKNDGTTKEVMGLLRLTNTEEARFRVNFVPGWLRFFGIGWGNYWILDLEENYRYAVVSEPKREFLWIVSRSPHMDQATLDLLLTRIKAWGFDTSHLIFSNAPALE
jgi:apolipoprotein D and lipocalin family protein